MGLLAAYLLFNRYLPEYLTIGMITIVVFTAILGLCAFWRITQYKGWEMPLQKKVLFFSFIAMVGGPAAGV